MNNGRWEVNYYQRGQIWETLFSTTDKEKAIQFYYNHVTKKEHLHLVAFTRSSDVFNDLRAKLESHGIITIQNYVAGHISPDDHIYRLLVSNKDIFRVSELLEKVPYVDEDIKVIW